MNIPKEKIFEMGYLMFVNGLKERGLMVSDEARNILSEFSKEEFEAFQEAVNIKCPKESKT